MNVYEEQDRLNKIRIQNLQRDNQTYGALWNMQQQFNNSDIETVLTDHTNDMAKLITDTESKLNDEEVLYGHVQQLLLQITTPKIAEYILNAITFDEAKNFVNNHKKLFAELRKSAYKPSADDLLYSIIEISASKFDTNVKALPYLQYRKGQSNYEPLKYDVYQELQNEDLQAQQEHEYEVQLEYQLLESKQNEADLTAYLQQLERERLERERVLQALQDEYNITGNADLEQQIAEIDETIIEYDSVIVETAAQLSDVANQVNELDQTLGEIKSGLDIFRDAHGHFSDITKILEEEPKKVLSKLGVKDVRNLIEQFEASGQLSQFNTRFTAGKKKGNLKPAKDLILELNNIARERNRARHAANPTPTGSHHTSRNPSPPNVPVTGNGFRPHSNIISQALKTPLFYGRGVEKDVKEPEKKDTKFKKSRKYYDKLYIDMDKLKKNILFCKYISSNTTIPKLKTQFIDNDTKDVINDIINEKYNKKVYAHLSDQNRRIVRNFVKAFKFDVEFDDNENDDFTKQFKILIGAYYSGNDSQEIKTKLKQYVRQAIVEDVITMKEGLNLLYELS